jgi:hypothetical protein
MKKKFAILLISAAAAATSFGSVSLQISLTTSGNGVLAGLEKHDGMQDALVWGIIVDVSGNGFAGTTGTNPYDGGFSFATSLSPIALTVNGGNATDDVLYLSGAAMAKTTNVNDNAANQYRPTLIAGIPFGGAVAANRAFAVVWFDKVGLIGTATTGTYYGVVTTPTTVDPNQSLVLPADGAGLNYSKNFLGNEAANPANLSLGTPVPEPSAALLGGLGLLGLLRRRR